MDTQIFQRKEIEGKETTYPVYICYSKLETDELKKEIEKLCGENSVPFIRSQISQNPNSTINFCIINNITTENIEKFKENNIEISKFKIKQDIYPTAGVFLNTILFHINKTDKDIAENKTICSNTIKKLSSVILTNLTGGITEDDIKVDTSIKNKRGEDKPIIIVDFPETINIECRYLLKFLLKDSNWNLDKPEDFVPIKCYWATDLERLNNVRDYLLNENNGGFKNYSGGRGRGRPWINSYGEEEHRHESNESFRGRGGRGRGRVSYSGEEHHSDSFRGRGRGSGRGRDQPNSYRRENSDSYRGRGRGRGRGHDEASTEKRSFNERLASLKDKNIFIED